MKKRLLKFGMLAMMLTTLASCSSTGIKMKEANTRVEFKKQDFELSDQLTGEASASEFLFVDWARLFHTESAEMSGGAAGINLSTIPVVGGVVSNKAEGYALYQLMKNNPGYDVVFYPQFETVVKKPIGVGVIKNTKVKVTARLGKLIK